MAKEKADVVVSWYFENAETQALRDRFTRPTRFLQMAAGPGTKYDTQLLDYGKTSIQNLLRAKLPNVEPQRVAVMGFSEGCRGVREALKCGDAGRLDAVFGIDGIHTQWVKPRETFETGLLLPWRAIAKKAVNGGPLVVITTSDVQPTYTDTTTTSNWIWEQATGTNEIFFDLEIPSWLMGPVEPPYTSSPGSFGPGQQSWKETVYTQYPLRVFRKSGGLWISNYYDLDPTGVGDHRFQAARVSPLHYLHVLIERWNSQEPEQGILLGNSTESAYLEMGKPEVAQAVALPMPNKDDKTSEGSEDTPTRDDLKKSKFPWGTLFAGVGVGALTLWGVSKINASSSQPVEPDVTSKLRHHR